MFYLKNKGTEYDFDETSGQPVRICHGGRSWDLSSVGFDFGCNEAMVNGLFAYESMLEFRTWNLPDIRPTGRRFANKPLAVEHDEEKVCVRYAFPQGEVQLNYRMDGRALRLDLTSRNDSQETLYLNACAFELRLPETAISADFPGNAPISHIDMAKLPQGETVQTGLINFATHIRLADGDLNLLFIDKTEKWSCGVYRDGGESCFVYNAGLEADLKSGESLSVGSLWILPCAPAGKTYSGDGNPYLCIRSFVKDLGYAPCEGGITEGVMYSCHPSGTMDAGFPDKKDLFAYAEELPGLKEMGIDHVWLLPVFEHDAGGVYHSTDQAVIDPRYGGEEGCKYFCDKAHELGMTVLFDYVPHGPAPEFPIAKDNPEWPSKRRDGSLQDEWECVSMDYNHPGYQEYTAELVHDHVGRFGVDGARIDCAMGGLSNWRPYGDNRPSGNSVLAGVHITEAVREGFLRGGKPSFILPENFNLIPNYYHCTDLFYGMNLYRAFVELESLLKTDPSEYVLKLTDFLERESWITPENYHKMRFLGNHDTVSWVWQSKRAAAAYGDEPAKALFALISFIDGMPMIYQGDEDLTICGKSGENLTEYFTRLFSDRKKYLPKGSNVTAYLHSAGPVMAFIRKHLSNQDAPYACEGSEDVLVLINFSDKEQEISRFPYFNGQILSDSAGRADAGAPLAPYAYRLIRVG